MGCVHSSRTNSDIDFEDSSSEMSLMKKSHYHEPIPITVHKTNKKKIYKKKCIHVWISQAKSYDKKTLGKNPKK